MIKLEVYTTLFKKCLLYHLEICGKGEVISFLVQSLSFSIRLEIFSY